MKPSQNNRPVPKNMAQINANIAKRAANNARSNGIQASQAPASQSYKVTTGEPRISRTARSFRVAHRELVLASVAGSTTFTVQKFLSLNPGLAATFPWLAPQAQQWEQYKCNRLVAEWIPIAPTSTQGDVILSPNYDASDPQPTTEVQAANNYGACQDSCWKMISCPLDMTAAMGLGPRRFVRPCAIAGDVKTFDIGTLAICSNNETGTSAIGKLYLDYDFEFFVPQNDPSPATTPLYSSLYYLSAPQTVTTAVPTAVQFDTKVFDPLNLNNASGVFTPPAGVYKVQSTVSSSDNTGEEFVFNIEVYKNGALQTGSTIRSDWTIGANQIRDNSVFWVLSMNGTDTFQIEVTLTGATGTLKVEKAILQVSLA